MSNSVFIVDGIRTPIGNFGGTLSAVRADDLAAWVLGQLVLKFPQLDPALIDDVYMGCANQAGEDNRNVARMAVLLAGLPVTVPAETVNRLCAGGMAAVVHAARTILSGAGQIAIGGGVEHMTRAPYVMSKSAKPFGTDAKMFDSSFGWRFINPIMEKMYGVEAMGMTAENLAVQYQIGREEQDEFALQSQRKAARAQEQGHLNADIAPIAIPQGKGDPVLFSKDEFLKPATSIEGLAKLRPAFKTDGTVTAGNASGLNDGAAALLLASEKALITSQLTPLCRIVGAATAGVEPRIMGIGPVPATQKLLAQTGISLDDIGIIELNEAFAAQSIACLKALNIAVDDPRINPQGGAIALGHPLGMSGSRIILSAARQLQRSTDRYALCTMCIGVGQGYAVLLERV